MPIRLPSPPSRPFASATSATKASTIAPTATASFTPVCAPCAAAMMMLAGFSSSCVASASAIFSSSITSPSGSCPAGGSIRSGMMILAIRMPPGAAMKLAASRYSIEMPIEA